jgi:hypothetical protein
MLTNSFHFSSYYLLDASNIAANAAQAMNFIRDDITPVIDFAMDWAMRGAMAATSTHAFIVLCKRFLTP